MRRITSRCSRPGPHYGFARYNVTRRPRLLSFVVRPQHNEMKRAELHACFARQFALDRLKPLGPCDDASIDRIEEALETILPCAYREFLTRCGPLFVPHLSDSIENTEL